MTEQERIEELDKVIWGIKSFKLQKIKASMESMGIWIEKLSVIKQNLLPKEKEDESREA